MPIGGVAQFSSDHTIIPDRQKNNILKLLSTITIYYLLYGERHVEVDAKTPNIPTLQ